MNHNNLNIVENYINNIDFFLFDDSICDVYYESNNMVLINIVTVIFIFLLLVILVVSEKKVQNLKFFENLKQKKIWIFVNSKSVLINLVSDRNDGFIVIFIY